MGHLPRSLRWLLLSAALAPLLSACESVPTDISISSRSSLLAVDVLFPAPLSRDPSLVQAFFVKGPIHGGMVELPELIPATFVKWSRAYLLDPEPGTYSLVAVSSALAPPWNDKPIAGVTQTRWSGTSSDALIFPAELIRRTRTTIGRGSVAFMGALRVRPGDRIKANAVFRGDLQRQLADRLRPGATTKSGLSSWFTRAWTVDLAETSLSNEAGDREAFFEDALDDLGDSPWGLFVAHVAPSEATTARSRPPAAHRPKATERVAPIPEVKNTAKRIDPTGETESVAALPVTAAPLPATAAAAPQSAKPDLGPLISEPEAEAMIPEPSSEVVAMAREPEAAPPLPERRPVPGLPSHSRLAEIEIGMSYNDVREILGPPDGRINRTTSKAWIPFYTGPGAYLRDWVYDGEGRVVFSLHDSSLEVIDVVYDPEAGS